MIRGVKMKWNYISKKKIMNWYKTYDNYTFYDNGNTNITNVYWNIEVKPLCIWAIKYFGDDLYEVRPMILSDRITIFSMIMVLLMIPIGIGILMLSLYVHG